MHRHALSPRPDWAAKVEALGFDFHTLEGAPYWDEKAYFSLTAAQVDSLEDAADELHRLCLEAVARVVAEGLYEVIGIPESVAAIVEASWRRRDPHLYGRFDLAWSGDGPPKLLEYNADTPTALFEAAVVQWQWLQDLFPDADQFNWIHEALVERWAAMDLGESLHLAASAGHSEDQGTLRYLEATALEAGLAAKVLTMEQIGWDGRRFVDGEDQPIRNLFKLYPWEWLLREEFGNHVGGTDTRFVEPAWKVLLSGKGILALLWEMFPGHPNLLPASGEAGAIEGRTVRKPLWGREGGNVAILDENGMLLEESPGPYGEEGWVYQAWHPLFASAAGHAVAGVWVVGDKACGLGWREDDGAITRNSSRFLPHLFR
ncbi:MAG: glutathionylspermidine synthase family protein [Magnetospirillum sp. WYHS-4]